MQADWQNYVNALTMATDVDVRETPLLVFPDGFSLLAVSGNDRHSFLHSQLINDLNQIQNAGAQYSAWCNPKGQVIANFLVINTGTSYLLLFRDDLKDYVQKRLTMFVLRADVAINDITTDSPLLGIANVTDTILAECNVDTAPGAVSACDGVITVKLPDDSGRYLMTGNTEALTARTSLLLGSLQAVPAESWSLLDIYAGFPWVNGCTQEKFLPQMLNLDALQALSYQKGCYPGQEVVARLHYRGEVKRRVMLVQTTAVVSAGEHVKTSTDENAGMVISSASLVNGDSICLAVIDMDKCNHDLYPDSDRDSAFTMLTLPYAID